MNRRRVKLGKDKHGEHSLLLQAKAGWLLPYLLPQALACCIQAGTKTKRNFNVKQNGDVTGSSVLFSGGTIGGFTIDADEIKSGTTFILDSDSNSGEIKLGAACDINTGDGIYMNGTGNAFRVGNPAGNELKFDGTSVFIGNDGGDHVEVDGTSLKFKSDGSTVVSE